MSTILEERVAVKSELPSQALGQQLVPDTSNSPTSTRDTFSTSPNLQTITIPDLFVSFVSQRPHPNPHYAEQKRDSEAWMSELCHWTPREYEKHRRADFTYFASIWTTEAGKDEFRTVVDWCNWVFDFDDLFDDGDLKDDSVNARREVDALIGLMEDPNVPDVDPSEFPLRYVFQTVWRRIRARVSIGAQHRFKKAMNGFFSGLTGQVDICSAARQPEKELYIALRRESIGVYPCLALVEYFHALDIPDDVFDHPSVREIEQIAADIVLLQNDILSYHKERAMGVNHNLVHLFRQDGYSQQDAYNKVNEMLKVRYRQWYTSQAELPLWGETVDVQVQKYIKGCQDVVLGNLNWSFASERYFGKQNKLVRKTRQVSGLP